MPARVLRVVSVSLGSSRRDIDEEVELLGHRIRLQRLGSDGSVARARQWMGELDGQVDAFGLGGLDLYLQWMGRRYNFREAREIASAARRTPVVCGAGLKDSLERRAVAMLAGVDGWRGKRVLLTVALDRFGMAEALFEHGADVRLGDLMFALGIPLPLTSMRQLDAVARVLAPPLTKLPIAWLYPTGAQQNAPRGSERYARHYRWAEVVAGDWHTIRRYAPARLDGLTILTNTTTRDDVAFLESAGVKRLVTTTPRFNGRSLATNLLEAAMVAVAGGRLAPGDYSPMLDAMDYAPTEVPLRARATGSAGC
jgi:hypothetical protein